MAEASPPLSPIRELREPEFLKVVTEYWAKPIPVRHFDWSATTDNYDGPGSPIGYGRTQAEAIADLMERIEERAS